MRKELAEVVYRIVSRVERDADVSAKTLESMVVGFGLTEEEMAKCQLGIAAYMRRRKWLKRELTVKGRSQILELLSDAEDVNLVDFDESDIELRVGAFSYNVQIPLEKMRLFDPTYEGKDGCSITENTIYPWSFIVAERVGEMTNEDRLLAAIFEEAEIGGVEKHENMHQFEDFLRGVFCCGGQKYLYREIARRQCRIAMLRRMNAPDVILRASESGLKTMMEAAGCTDSGLIYERACNEGVRWILGRVKSELLAFFWANDVTDLVKNIRCGYLCKWIDNEQKFGGLDLSDKMSELVGLTMDAIDAICCLANNLVDDGNSQRYSMKLAAMMNIDKPLMEWV